MEIYVQFRGKTRKEIGVEDLKVSIDESPFIFDLFDVLEDQLHWPFKKRFVDPETGDLQGKVIVLVNGLPIRGKIKSIRLRDGDKVILFPHTVCG